MHGGVVVLRKILHFSAHSMLRALTLCTGADSASARRGSARCAGSVARTRCFAGRTSSSDGCLLELIAALPNIFARAELCLRRALYARTVVWVRAKLYVLVCEHAYE